MLLYTFTPGDNGCLITSDDGSYNKNISSGNVDVVIISDDEILITKPGFSLQVNIAEIDDIDGAGPAGTIAGVRDQLRAVFPNAGGSASPTVIELTYADAQALIVAQTVVPGQSYHITDATGTDLGVIVTGVSTTAFSLRGSGGFLNPDYNGVGDYSGVDDVTGIAPAGDPANVGVWQSANEGGYILGTIVIWNGLHYQVINTSTFEGVSNPAENETAYQLLPKSASNVGYITEWDDVEFDFANNWVQRHICKRGNDVSMSYLSFTTITGDSPFSIFQWGNDNVFGNVVKNSTVSCLNNLGVIRDNILIDNFFPNLTFGVNGGIVECDIKMAGSVDFSGVTTAWQGKTLSPHLSTFDAVIDMDAGTIVANVLTIPDYVGTIKLAGNLSPYTISSFSTQPSFERTFYMDPVTQPSVTFNNDNDLVFPSPSLSTTFTSVGKADFIKFLFKSDFGGFHFQTASEQY